jgi:hypothetical protein
VNSLILIGSLFHSLTVEGKTVILKESKIFRYTNPNDHMDFEGLLSLGVELHVGLAGLLLG